MGFLVGQVMRVAKGKANPKLVNALRPARARRVVTAELGDRRCATL